MPLSVKDLQKALTKPDIAAVIFSELSAMNFPVEAWQAEAGNRAYIETATAMGVRLSESIAALAKAPYSTTAKNDFLDALLESHYRTTRNQATFAQLNCTAFNSTGAPINLTSASPTRMQAGGQTFKNLNNETVPAGGSTNVEVIAENAGSASNIAPQGMTLVTPIAGLTVTFGGSFISPGRDAERDEAYADRATSQWGTLRVEKAAIGVENLARNADANITHVGLDDQNPRGPGTGDVYIARLNSLAVGSDINNAQAAMDLAFMGNGLITKRVEVFAAAAFVLNAAGTVYYSGTAPVAAVDAAWSEFVNSIPLGGFDLTNQENIILTAQMLKAIGDVEGVEAVNITSPSSNLTVGGFLKVIRGAFTFDYVSID